MNSLVSNPLFAIITIIEAPIPRVFKYAIAATGAITVTFFGVMHFCFGITTHSNCRRLLHSHFKVTTQA